jgi:L-histidine Nalpha-methyltransferase
MNLDPALVHPSREPIRVQQRLLDSLAQKEMDHQFHYVSPRQAQLWLDVHQQHSPARQDKNVLDLYQEVFAFCAKQVCGSAQVVGLGCGGGKKDAALIQALSKRASALSYLAADVSPALVQEARLQVAHSTGLGRESLQAWVVDLREVVEDTLPWKLGFEAWGEGAEQRFFTFLGMLPNFDPHQVLPILSRWLRPQDFLILSANLSPGDDYEAGCQAILPQYDNPETRRWLFAVLEDLGVAGGLADLSFGLGEVLGIKRIESSFTFPKKCRIDMEGVSFSYEKGERLRLFYSNRFRPSQLDRLLERCDFVSRFSQLSESREEGVWVVQKKEVIEPT